MGDLITGLFLGFLLTADLLFVRFKWNKQGAFPAIIDISLLILINAILGGTIMGEIIGTIAAFLISIYLWFYPPRLLIVFEKRSKGYR
jgi:fucose permease